MYVGIVNHERKECEMKGIFFDEQIRTEAFIELGEIMERSDIKSSAGPFHVFSSYAISYPEIIVRALGELYLEYNCAFISSVEANREWSTDYQYCIQDGLPVNFAVQVDMVGLPGNFLKMAEGMPLREVKNLLRKRIFEIENSIAMYQLLAEVFSNGKDSYFKSRFRASLNRLRRRFRKPLALLAVTQPKYDAMKALEFGKETQDPLSDEEVFELSGFDKFFGPREFLNYLEENNGECHCLLYARTSDPVAKLKNPSVEIEHPLLSDPDIRRIIKANAITFNVDSPEMDYSRRINDTKEYQSLMGMAFSIATEFDLYSLEFAKHSFSDKPYVDFKGSNRLSDGFRTFLERQGIDPRDVESGAVELRCKPKKCAYGCYGHVVGALKDGRFRSELRRNLRQREGGYVIQVEMPIPKIMSPSGEEYVFIDRNFLSFTNGQPWFLGGFRSLLPVDCHETKRKRNHGNVKTVLAEITA